jgi:hypothetical protein
VLSQFWHVKRFLDRTALFVESLNPSDAITERIVLRRVRSIDLREAEPSETITPSVLLAVMVGGTFNESGFGAGLSRTTSVLPNDPTV